ncbi:MAG: hypothetical protein GX664_04715 [Bacteroidales bacterium]|nr:hypothetical protein [Bacteroidales bacterium]
MKKVFFLSILTLLLSSCGVGVYSVSSGKADQSEISFVAADKCELDVTIDNNAYKVDAVKQKDWRKNRNIKKTDINTITIPVGQHDLIVVQNGVVVYSKKIFVSAGEHKIIEL